MTKQERYPMETIYLAGGCLWGVQEFIRHIPGIIHTQAGRANGTTNTTQGNYDGYAECVQIDFDPMTLTVTQLINYLFEIIDPYSVNKQGNDVGLKYRSGIYSKDHAHLTEALRYITTREDAKKIAVEVLPLTNYVKSDETHQDRLSRHPDDHQYCHIPWALLHKYKQK